MTNVSSSTELVALIDNLLKSAPPPPDAVLKKVASVLTKARKGGEAQDGGAFLSSSVSSTSSSSAFTASARPSTASSSVGGAAAAKRGNDTASSILSDAAAFYKKRGERKTASALAAAVAEDDQQEDGDELGMSLPIYGKPDPVHERMLTRYAVRQERTTNMPIPDVRANLRRQYQMLLEGNGGKVVHADVRANGATQIGGATSCTPSMTAGGGKNEMSRVASQLATRPPRIRNSPKDFRVA